MKKVISAFLVSALLVLGSGVNTANASKTSGSCKKIGAIKVSGDVGYTCTKKGKKLIWRKVFVAPAENLKATRDRSQITYSWMVVNPIEKIRHFEIGISLLKKAGLTPTLSSSYTKPKVFSLVTETQSSIAIGDLKSYLERQALTPEGQAALVRVRVITTEGASAWSNGIYTLYETLKVVSPPPASQSTPTPVSPPSGGSTPAPATTSVKTFYGYNSIQCPSGSVVSGGLGTIPQTTWNDWMGNPLDTVSHRTATFSWQGGGAIAYGQGISILYVRQSNGSFVAPNGYRYYESGRGSWSVPVWISCLVAN